MKKSILALAAVAVLATGCKSDAQKICDKMESLAKDVKKDEKGKADEMAACVKGVEEMKKKDPEAFKGFVTCVDGITDESGIVGCMMKKGDKDKDKDKDKSDKK